HILERLTLDLLQRDIALNESYLRCFQEPRYDASGAQGVPHQGAPPWSKLDEIKVPRGPHGAPGDCGPDADQLAEDLADLRCRGEVARGADGSGFAVVAMLRVVEASPHIRFDRNRPCTLQLCPELQSQRGFLSLAVHQAPAAALILA